MSWRDWFGNKREQNIVLLKLNDVYSLLEVVDRQLHDLNDRLSVIIPTDVTPAELKRQLETLRAYVHVADQSIGGVVERLPEPPIALTGRRRGTT